MRKIFVIAFCVFLLCGCGEKEVEKEENVNIEEDEESDIEEVEEEKEEINIISRKEYELDGEEVTIILDEDDGNYKVTVFGYANTEEKASILLTSLSTHMKGIDYSISVRYEELFMTVTSDGTIAGVNRDGSVSYSAPDWYGFPEEENLTEEQKEYFQDIIKIEEDFLENIQNL